MDTLIKEFTNQLRSAIEIGNKFEFPKYKGIKNIIVSGMGGSGIGGSLVYDWVKNEFKVPFIVNKSYTLPSFANKNTLVVISSYSGNTEETLSVLNQAIAKECNILIISTGGQCVEIAKKYNLPCVIIPGGQSPRASIGYSFIQLIFALVQNRIINKKIFVKIDKSIKQIDKEEEKIQKIAKGIAEKIFNKIPIIYSSDAYEATAVRLKQQINENSKQYCWNNTIPEMNHNEIVGWRESIDKIAVLIFRNEDDDFRVANRINISKITFAKFSDEIIEIQSKGKSNVERSIYLIHLGDWLSFYLSELRNFDPIEVDVIDDLKNKLNSMPS
jgi:glucose/mannose-6-phosphate isomerase